jgi:hypothetical protein
MEINFWKYTQNPLEMKFNVLLKSFFQTKEEITENTKIALWLFERFLGSKCGINFNKVYPIPVFDFANTLLIFLRHSKFEILQKILKTVGICLPGTNALQKRTDYSTSLFGAEALREIKNLLIRVNEVKNPKVSLSANFDQIFVERKPTIKSNHILSGQIFASNIFYKCLVENANDGFNLKDMFSFDKTKFPKVSIEDFKNNTKFENWQLIFKILELNNDTFFPYKASLSAFEIGQYLLDLCSIFEGKEIGEKWILPQFGYYSKNLLGACPYDVI